MIALSVLAVAGVATVRVVHESARAVAVAQRADAEIARAGAFLEWVALWSASDLDRHLGTRVQGDWRMYIERGGGATYRIVLLDSTRRRVLLETSLYRPQRGAAGSYAH
jgi:hypothetical protein